jgi:hypothetical protein
VVWVVLLGVSQARTVRDGQCEEYSGTECLEYGFARGLYAWVSLSPPPPPPPRRGFRRNVMKCTFMTPAFIPTGTLVYVWPGYGSQILMHNVLGGLFEGATHLIFLFQTRVPFFLFPRVTCACMIWGKILEFRGRGGNKEVKGASRNCLSLEGAFSRKDGLLPVLLLVAVPNYNATPPIK